MEAKYLVLNDCGDGEALKDVSEEFPDEVSVIFFEAFVIEAVEFVDLSVLVVAAENSDPALVLDLEEQDVEEGLDTVEAAINVIPHEEVVGALGRTESTGSLPQI